MARMPADQEQAVLDAYQAWDPRTSSTQDLVAQLGISRTTLFNVLARNGVTPKTRTAGSGSPAGDDLFVTAARLLLDDLYRRTGAAEARVALLEAAIRAHPRCRHRDQLVEALG